jgi:acyl carrier protein
VGRGLAAPAAAYNLRLFGAHDLQMVPVEVPVSLQPTASAAGPGAAALERELATLFVEALNLETTAEAIDADAPLFGDGLGLDSIDILEVALEISHRYGFQLRSDDENNHRIFQSLRSLAAHVAEHRTK